ncbi:Lipid droplet-associated hydrolase [Aphelenchoides besseyi]|nr:Lipid droplet-associated hydrolase [Aphelenchoides besseyi]
MNISELQTWCRFNARWTRYSTVRASKDLDEVTAKHDTTILILPGNPGNDGFYDDFALAIVQLLNKECQTFTLAHLNHVPLPPGLAHLEKHQLLERFDLHDQITHAYDFVKNIVSPTMTNKNLVIVGHSIGAFIGAKIKKLLEVDGFKVNLIGLFPTLTNMADTPAGKRVRPYINFVRKYDTLTRVSLWGFRWLPIEIKRFLIRLFIRRPPPSASVNQAAAELIDGLVFRNVCNMAANELDIVRSLDPKLKESLKEGDVHLYYGLSDHWVPTEYADDIAQQIGKDRVVFDDTGSDHAFVLKDSRTIAKKVVDLFLS